VPHTTLDTRDASAGIALVPGPVEVFCCYAELDNKVAGEVFRLGFPAFFAPEAHQSSFVGAQ
jgi:hypothetical protein